MQSRLLTVYPAGVQARRYLAQQRQTVRAGISRVIVREKVADIPHGRRAEQRIHDGMRQHVRVRVAEQAVSYGMSTPPRMSLRP